MPTSFLALPNELKLHILHSLLPRNESYDVAEFMDPGYAPSTSVFTYHTTVLPLLCIPEVRAIVAESFFSTNDIGMFYGKHWIDIQRLPDSLLGISEEEEEDDCDPVFLMPSRYVRPHLRNFQIIVNEMTPKLLDFLERMAAPEFGLGVLDCLDITFACCHRAWYYDVEDILKRLEKCPGIAFPTRRLVVEYQHHALRMVPVEGSARRRECKDVLEMPLLDKLSIRSTGEPGESVSETWERFAYFTGSEEQRVSVDRWPRMKHVKQDRLTRKVVEVT